MLGIENTYFHAMSISRLQDLKDEWGATIQKYEPLDLLQLVPCGFSQNRRGTEYNTTRTENRTIVETTPKVFCNPNLDIQAGDRITINYNTRVIGEYTAAEPYIYGSHQEVPLQKVGEA